VPKYRFTLEFSTGDDWIQSLFKGDGKMALPLMLDMIQGEIYPQTKEGENIPFQDENGNTIGFYRMEKVR